MEAYFNGSFAYSKEVTKKKNKRSDKPNGMH